MSYRLVRVEPVDTDWLKIRTELLSNRIAELVFERIRIVTKARLLETLVQYLADPDAHTKAGILFEHAAHFSIRKGLVLRMTCLSSGTHLKVSIPVTAVGNAVSLSPNTASHSILYGSHPSPPFNSPST